jgi:hypothetical protein
MTGSDDLTPAEREIIAALLDARRLARIKKEGDQRSCTLEAYDG